MPESPAPSPEALKPFMRGLAHDPTYDASRMPDGAVRFSRRT